MGWVANTATTVSGGDSNANANATIIAIIHDDDDGSNKAVICLGGDGLFLLLCL
jgi:hypothetical protein